MAKINILALGGLDEKQRRLYILEIDSKMYIVDSGVYEPLNHDFGIKHYVPNMDYIVSNVDKLKAVFLSSANRMNIGSLLQLTNIKKDVEVYGSKSTLDSLKIFFKGKGDNINTKVISGGDDFEVGGVAIKALELPSTIPGTLGYKFATEDGNVVFMSDYVFDSIKEYNTSVIGDISDLAREKNLLFVSDSSGATSKDSEGSKFRIKDLVSKYVHRENRFIITIYEDEILNVVELMNLAKENKKKLFVKSKTLFNLINILKTNGQLDDFPVKHYSDYRDEDWSKSIVILSGTRTKLYKTVELIIEAQNKEDFAFAPGDQVYFAAVPQAGNEHVFADVTNKISRLDVSFTKPEKENRTTFSTTGFDIRNMLNIIKPDFFFPVSAYFTQLDAARRIALQFGIDEKKIFIGDNGDTFTINKGSSEGLTYKVKEIEPKVVEQVGLDSINNDLIEERKVVGKDGVVTISFIFDEENLVIASDIDVQMKGVVISKGLEDTIENIKEVIRVASDVQSETKQSVKKALPSLKKEINKIFRQSINKVPTLLFNIMEI